MENHVALKDSEQFFSSSNYWINIDKPYNLSSSKVVSIVKRLTKAKKVGHAGTLDPLATGVLPIAVNKATKTCDYVMNSKKEYYFEITWGEFRDTDDLEGKITETNNKKPTTNEILNILPKFIGTISQTPPQFSAIKINGRKAYELARKNEKVELKPRIIQIPQIELIFNNNKKAGFKVSCSKGTYIRSLSRQIATEVQTCGYISKLTRLKTSNFEIKNAISLDKLKNIIMFNQIDESLVKLRDVLNFMTEIVLNDDLAFKIKNGQKVQMENSLFTENHNSLIKLINNDEVIGLGKIYENRLKPVNIFNN